MIDISTLADIDRYNEIETYTFDNIEDFKNKLSINSFSGLNIIHQNIRSISKNFNEFLVYLNEIDLRNVDILILTETWTIQDTKNFNIDQFNCYYNSSHFNKCDGVLVYIKDNIIVEKEDIKISQSTLLEIKCTINNINFNITAIYRPPSTNLETFLNDIDTYLGKLNYNNTVNVVVGDVNINLLDINSELVRKYLNTLAKYSFSSYINKPTRVTNISTSILDHIFINGINKVKKQIIVTPVIIKTNITDHYLTYVKFNTQENINTQKKIIRKKYKIDTMLLLDRVRNETWRDVLSETDTIRAYDIFINKLEYYINNSKKEIKYSCKQKAIKPWITPAIITSIRKRDRMKKDLNTNFNQEKNNQYKNYRNLLTNLIRKTKDDYYKNKLESEGKSIKNTWNIIKEVTNENHKAVKPVKLKINNDIITDYKQISNQFNEHFIKIGSKISSNIKKSNIKINNPQTFNNNSSFFLKPVSNNEIIKHIASLKTSSSPGPDKISATTLKMLHTHIVEPLKHIINLIFITSVVPNQFKVAHVTPVHKQGTKTDPNNYRPISLINNISKIFEKCINERLKDFLGKHNLLSQNQFGFREGYSTESAIQKVTSILSKNLNEKFKTLIIYLDLAKAFDTVSHRILLQKLEKMGIRGIALKLFENYLSNRHQATIVNGTLSDLKLITCGIPQGTVLGPTLFLIYINELCNIKINGKVLSYADDTVSICQAKTWYEAYKIASYNISIIKCWLDHHNLALNITKTKFITYSTSAADLPAQNQIKIHQNQNCLSNSDSNLCNCNSEVLRTNHIKYLGVEMDQHLKWDFHINNLLSKLRKLIFKFNQLKNILSESNLNLVYLALVESVLKYGIIGWGGVYDNTLQPLVVCQKLLLKIIYKKEKTYSTALLFEQANVFNIRFLYYHSNIINIHKIIKNPLQHNRHTRSQTNKFIACIKPTTSLVKRTFYYLGPKLYNKIPLELRQINNLKVFYTKTKDYIKNKNIEESFINKI